jgi:hypothetical protein
MLFVHRRLKVKKRHPPPQKEYPELVFKDIRIDKVSYEKLCEWARSQRISDRKALARLLHYGVKYYTELLFQNQQKVLIPPVDDKATEYCYKHIYLDKDSWELLDYWAHQRKIPKTTAAAVLVRYGIASQMIKRVRQLPSNSLNR